MPLCVTSIFETATDSKSAAPAPFAAAVPAAGDDVYLEKLGSFEGQWAEVGVGCGGRLGVWVVDGGSVHGVRWPLESLKKIKTSVASNCTVEPNV